MRYTGPAKPIPLHGYHPVGQRVLKASLLLFLIGVLLMDLLVWRPG